MYHSMRDIQLLHNKTKTAVTNNFLSATKSLLAETYSKTLFIITLLAEIGNRIAVCVTVKGIIFLFPWEAFITNSQ